MINKFIFPLLRHCLFLHNKSLYRGIREEQVVSARFRQQLLTIELGMTDV
jgi:hypothetical protein